MPTTPNAAASGTFLIGGDIPVHRLGYGAMRITGPGIWGPPADPAAALATLRRLPELGVNFIDTADSYGPFVSEDLIREALHPYAGLLIATKGGLLRHGPDKWVPLGDPGYLRQCVLMSLRRLGLERIDLWQLHRLDPGASRQAQLQAIADMRREGLIRHVGLSEVQPADIQEAQQYFPVATVQNQYNLGERKSEAVLDYCTEHRIGFIPWYPLNAGKLARPGSKLEDIARHHGVTTSAIALAWLLKRSPVMLPIPGTANPDHLAQNVAAAQVSLSDQEFDALDRAAA
ncbi:aldo/keto reductase [Castellaniella defragrans]|uniref:Aryl-alcohol dehydrogenase-like predicted oxidoreductase n=1 Tax=Castellaniella defragrans TaxID=75697 RepID=A0A7W9TNX7_CASDE|nr:aldo/keto reductase [Castellaniella defragrans]KAB0622272.1 aldo/keto reductase [Castellaniella defragrans]MBB6084195.1 aryl-alcohol dehydrogenase-like predicted oxidoreductase [Castellaniella defragrans]